MPLFKRDFQQINGHKRGLKGRPFKKGQCDFYGPFGFSRCTGPFRALPPPPNIGGDTFSSSIFRADD